MVGARRLVRRSEILASRQAQAAGSLDLGTDSEGDSSEGPSTNKVVDTDMHGTGEDQGPVESRGTSRGEGLENLLAATAPKTLAEWLRSLSLDSAQAVNQVMRSGLKLDVKSQCSESDLEILPFLKAAPGDEGRDGRWWLTWCTCEVVVTTDKGASHPRWQVRLGCGPASVGEKLRSVLSDVEFEGLRWISDYPKFQAHHIAYNADPRREAAPLPLDCGSGGSISHLCDERGCLNHLEATPIHMHNMDRQRCSGVVLIVLLGVIIKVVPCSHGMQLAGDDTLESQISSSCRRLRLVELYSGTVRSVLCS